MSADAIKSIGEAEEEARKARIYAQEKAALLVIEAEKAGQETVEATLARAELEIADLGRLSDQKAREEAVELASWAANRQATLRARAEGRLDKAAELIVERILAL